MARFEISAPVANFNGFSAGVAFTDGKAVITSDTDKGLAALGYFRGAGYGIRALDEVRVDEVLVRSNEDPSTEAARLRREIDELETRLELDNLRRRRDELHREVYGDEDPHAVGPDESPRQAGEAEIPATLSPGSTNAAEGDLPAEQAELLAPPMETAPVAEWRAWAVAAKRATPEQVASPVSKADIIATYGAAYDRDREAQLSAGSDEGGKAPQEGDRA